MEPQKTTVCNEAYAEIEFTLYCHDSDGNIVAEIPCTGQIQTEPKELGE